LAVPTFDTLTLPVLQLASERTWAMKDLVVRVADVVGVSQEDRERLLPSGGMTVIANRVHWARSYLKQAGLVESPKRGFVQITAVGREVLSRQPPKINVSFLEQFADFRAFQKRTRSEDSGVSGAASAANAPSGKPDPLAESATPDEQISSAFSILDEALREALLSRILEKTPAFFEKTIVDLLVAMGYGGSRADAGEQLGGTGDGGVDGVIREDQLGLDRVYLQAKQYQRGNVVGPEAVRGFMGALVGKGAQKGVFITTSSFSRGALSAASQSGHLRLVLIDGEELTKLMIRFDVGVRVTRAIKIKDVDLGYFEAGDPE
jgi:restriction system protein